ncbi:HAD hydrolase family protein [soil metagenome]
MDKQNIDKDILVRARKVKLLLMDCDGVLTDGRLYYSEKGEALKVFNVKDGQGIVCWHKAGYKSGIISGRESVVVEKRATELGVSHIKQNSHDKTRCFSEILLKEKISQDEVAFIGDDIGDIDLLKIVGFPVTVADAARELFPFVLYKTKANGGYGAVREVIDLLLNSKD